MAMLCDTKSVKFFHRTLPIVEEPEPIRLVDGEYKFWEFVGNTREGKEQVILSIRTKLVDGKWRPLQERLDQFIWQDSSVVSAVAMAFADYVRPASKVEIDRWMQGHKWLYK